MTDVAVRDAVDTYLQRKAVGDPGGSGAGTYASNAESILRRWVEWLEAEHSVSSIADLDIESMRSYAIELRRRTDRGEYTASTAGTYYAVVRAFLSWCVRGGICETNPAATDRAEDALPNTDPQPDSDCWTATQRRKLERDVRKRAVESASRPERERRSRLREYAMVAVLAHSTVRGSELFRVPDDDRRTGATWDDVDFYTGTVRVLGKSQRLEDVPLPARARTPLRRYRVVLDPPSTDWPLFPTAHAPSIARRVRSVLRERGYDDAAIEALLEDTTAVELARERSIAPPAITTEGARSVLRRLCKAAGIDVDGDYLTPRGVRREQSTQSYRQEATASKPTLRASVLEQSVVVPADQPSVIDTETPEGEDSSDTE